MGFTTRVEAIPEVLESQDEEVDSLDPMFFPAHKLPRLSKLNSRLKVGMTMIFPDGSSREITALVDTGAEVNLVRSDLVDPSFFKPSKRPVRLGASNSTRLCGGSNDVELILGMGGVESDNKRALDFRVPFVAYDAAISHDVIISYRWLAENKAIVCPERHGLLFTGRGQEMVWVVGLPSPERAGGIITLKAEDLLENDEHEVLDIEILVDRLSTWGVKPSDLDWKVWGEDESEHMGRDNSSGVEDREVDTDDTLGWEKLDEEELREIAELLMLSTSSRGL